jgi:uncharacterized membrane protein
MEKQFKHISHKFIDTLSDGVFSIALTLLGLNVVEMVPEVSESKNLNTALLEHWPTFFAYFLGFVVLFSTWYQYHATSQYTEGTNAWVVWQHGLSMAWIALMPFGVALLAENLDTENRKYGVFYFGVCLFGNYWTTMILAAFTKFRWPVDFTEDLPVKIEDMRKAVPIFMGVTAIIGLALVCLSLVFPWAALIGYGAFVLSNVNPIKTLNRVRPILEKMVNSESTN